MKLVTVFLTLLGSICVMSALSMNSEGKGQKRGRETDEQQGPALPILSRDGGQGNLLLWLEKKAAEEEAKREEIHKDKRPRNAQWSYQK